MPEQPSINRGAASNHQSPFPPSWPQGTTVPSGEAGRGETSPPPGAQDPELETLRAIFVGPERNELRHLARRLAQLEAQLQDKAALAEVIAPALGPALRKEIREAQDEIVDALYPIIGRLIMRAVTEAMRDLVRTVEARLDAALDWPNVLKRKIRAWWSGVPEAELALREAVSGSVEEIFLVHRETGLLLWHGARPDLAETDPDLVGAMLTAIQDFAAQVLNRGADKEGIHELVAGQRTILVEFGPYSYVAAVVRGVPPPGLHQRLALRVLDFDSAYQHRLRRYDGDARELALAAQELFGDLLAEQEKSAGSR